MPRNPPVEILPRLERLAAEGGALRKVHMVTARLKHHQGELVEAIKYAEAAVGYMPNNVDYRIFLTKLLLEAGKLDRARDVFDNTPRPPNRAKPISELEEILNGSPASKTAAPEN